MDYCMSTFMLLILLLLIFNSTGPSWLLIAQQRSWVSLRYYTYFDLFHLIFGFLQASVTSYRTISLRPNSTRSILRIQTSISWWWPSDLCSNRRESIPVSAAASGHRFPITTPSSILVGRVLEAYHLYNDRVSCPLLIADVPSVGLFEDWKVELPERASSRTSGEFRDANHPLSKS